MQNHGTFYRPFWSNPTRLNSINGNLSVIDLSIATPTIASDIEWDTLTSYNGSDYWPIILKLSHIIPQPEPINKWRLKNPNWELFSSLVDHALQNSQTNEVNLITPDINQNKIDDLVLNLTNSIIEAATVAIRKSNRPINHKIVPWWNDECITYIKKYKISLNRFKKTRLLADHILLKKAQAESKYILKKNKTSSWKNFTSTINNHTRSSTLWNKIRAFKGIKYQHIPNTLHYEHENIQVELSSTCDITQSFAKCFQANSSNSNFDNDFAIYKRAKDEYFNINSYIRNNNNEYNLPLTIEELHSELGTCTNKSPRPDDIPYIFIKTFQNSYSIKYLQSTTSFRFTEYFLLNGAKQ